MMVRVFAPAKINLTLEVGRPRADGMHPLQSVVVFASVGDWVEAAPAEGLSLTVRGPFAAGLGGDDNLVLRAAHVLAEAHGVHAGAALTLEKNLPVAAGIGGGSSDAAAALKALNALWRLDLDEATLSAFARKLGADVPVCVVGRSAWMTGDGDQVSPFAAPALHAVLANPLQTLSTAAVFREFDRLELGLRFSPRTEPHWPDANAAIAGAMCIGNDLAAPARALMPAIGDIEAKFRAYAGVHHVGVSGSGATVFALVPDAETAASIASDLANRARSWWVVPALLGGA